ncbi:MAG: DUF6293 family protein [Halodesulfurarchaeum sp.]|nr:DUF6293 family protein [Halodesulfurarchaeum sp.]
MADEQVHIIPVGFDYERLFQPITQGKLEADRIHLLHSSREESDQEAQQLAKRMLDKLEETFDTVLGKPVEKTSVNGIFEFEELYPMAYEMILGEVEDGNEVWINISSMPRTVAFAFATAANSLLIENSDYQNRIHTYYVSPEEYLVTKMIRQFKEEKEFLKNHRDKGEKFEERYQKISEITDSIEDSGVTKGAEKKNGGMHVEFPTIPSSDLHKFEKTILHFLDSNVEPDSISDLSQKLAAENQEDIDLDSFKSKVQYNINQLENKGFVELIKEKNRHKPRLDTMGKLWVKTHNPA